MAAALSREMAITKAEFMRRLPDAVQGRPFRVDDGIIIVDATDNGLVRIQLTQKGGTIEGGHAQPLLHVDFAFQNMTVDEARMFMHNYDSHMTSMGGT